MSEQSINQEVLDNKNDVASKGAHDIVAMATANALQTEIAMHAGFETTSNTVLTLAMEKMAQDAIDGNEIGVKIWEKVIASITQSRIKEAEGLEKFHQVAEDLVNNFPRD